MFILSWILVSEFVQFCFTFFSNFFEYWILSNGKFNNDEGASDKTLYKNMVLVIFFNIKLGLY